MDLLVIDGREAARTELCQALQFLLPSSRPLEACDIAYGRETILTRRVDGVFLDLCDAGPRGLEFAKELRALHIPVVVTTSSEDHAVAAFEVDVTDYLLRPIEQGRLMRAVAKMRKTDVGRMGAGVVVFSDQTHCWPVPVDDVILAESEGSYVTLHVRGRKPILLCRSLKEIELLLGDKDFVRVNRSQVVRLQALVAIRREDAGFAAEVADWGRVIFSRRQAQAFRQRFGV
jgi:DNA-binding LytR/AlgR family response regulator